MPRRCGNGGGTFVSDDPFRWAGFSSFGAQRSISLPDCFAGRNLRHRGTPGNGGSSRLAASGRLGDIVTTKEFADGTLRITYPDPFDAPSTVSAPEPGQRGLDTAESSVDDSAALLVAALGQQEFELVEPVELVPEPRAATRGDTAGQSGTWTFDLDVAADEDAVVLLDQDGVLSWQYPVRQRDQAAAPPQRRRGYVVGREIRFDISLAPHAASAPPAGQTRIGRGLIGGFVLGQVRAYVLKFVAKAVAGHAMAFLERKVTRGLSVIESPDPRQWRLVGNLSEVRLPADRPARILLLVHGTFSSTAGSFAALAATPEGRSFLESALRSYDAIIGFEHPTLSRDPMENAIDLLTRLEAASLAAPPTVDILCYSRGGLVARSLIEYLLPSSKWRANVGRVVFVGATNAGTGFAEPEHWNDLIDLYTNLAMASARAIGLVSGAVPVAEIVRGVIDGVGAFVKYLVAYAVDGDVVPGLAAMEPDGDFVRRINETQPGQPLPGTPWFVVSSDFQPQLIGDDDQLPALPARLVALLADGLVDQLFNAPNDLVVDTASMSAIDLMTAGFVQDSLAFDVNGRVYHLAYFIQPEVADALHDWLLGERGSGAVPRGSVVSLDLPRSAQKDLVTVDVGDAVAVIRETLKSRKPTWVVVEETGETSTQRYSLDRETITSAIQGQRGTLILREAISLDQYRAPSVELNDLLADRADYSLGTEPNGTIVVDRESPIAVVRRPPPPLSLDVLAERVQPPRGRSRGLDEPGRAPTRRRRAKPRDPKLSAHLDAQMPARVQRKEVVSVACRLSREELAVPPGGVGGVFPVEDREITLQLVPKLNTEVIGDDRVSLPLPPAGEISVVFFDVKPTDLGICEVWVVARQGPLPLLTLELKASVEEELSDAGTDQITTGASVPAEPIEELENLQLLNIWETEKGGKIVYLYDIIDPQLGVAASGRSPEIENREDYVKDLYREIEDFWKASGEDSARFGPLLQDFGTDLLSRLVPESIQRALWQHRDQLDRLVVRSDEPFIPWELVHLKDPEQRLRPEEPLFLGQFGLVRWLSTAPAGVPPRGYVVARAGSAACVRVTQTPTPTRWRRLTKRKHS